MSDSQDEISLDGSWCLDCEDGTNRVLNSSELKPESDEPESESDESVVEEEEPKEPEKSKKELESPKPSTSRSTGSPPSKSMKMEETSSSESSPASMVPAYMKVEDSFVRAISTFGTELPAASAHGNPDSSLYEDWTTVNRSENPGQTFEEYFLKATGHYDYWFKKK